MKNQNSVGLLIKFPKMFKFIINLFTNFLHINWLGINEHEIIVYSKTKCVPTVSVRDYTHYSLCTSRFT